MPPIVMQDVFALSVFVVVVAVPVAAILLLVRVFGGRAEPPRVPVRRPTTRVSGRGPVRRKEERLVAGERRAGFTETPVEAPPESDLVPVASFASSAEAGPARERLAEAGIEATLVGAHALSTERTYGPGIELHVRQADAEEALAVLDEMAAAEAPLDEDDFVVPPEKAGDLVTVATFDSPIEAQLAQARLEDAGIRCRLADAQLIAMDWVLSTAVGGIKLQVLGADAPAALRVLAEPAEEPDAVSPTAFSEEEPPATPREQDAERAAKAALLGILLWPIQFYAFALLLGVWQSPEPLRPEYRTRAVLAAFVAVPFVVAMTLPVVLLAWFLVAR